MKNVRLSLNSFPTMSCCSYCFGSKGVTLRVCHCAADCENCLKAKELYETGLNILHSKPQKRKIYHGSNKQPSKNQKTSKITIVNDVSQGTSHSSNITIVNDNSSAMTKSRSPLKSRDISKRKKKKQEDPNFMEQTLNKSRLSLKKTYTKKKQETKHFTATAECKT